MGCIAMQLLCPRHGQPERASARGARHAAGEQARVQARADAWGAQAEARGARTDALGAHEGAQADA